MASNIIPCISPLGHPISQHPRAVVTPGTSTVVFTLAESKEKVGSLFPSPVIGLAHGTYFTENTLAISEIATPIWAGFSL